MLINDLYTNKTPAVAEAIGDLGSSRDRGKSVRKWRKQRGLDEQGPTDVSRRGFLRGLAAFAASAAVPAPVVKLLSTPAGVATLPVAAGIALLKGIQEHLNQFDPEDDDDYYEAWESMADELGFEGNDDEGIYPTDQLSQLLDLNDQNPELAAAQLIKHIQSGAGVNPEDVKSSFVARADDPSDWRYQRKQQDAKGVEIAQQLRAASLRWRNKDDDDDDDDDDAGSNQIISTLLGHAADKFELDINAGIELWRKLAAHSGREGFDDAQEEIYLTLQDHGIDPKHAYKATSGAADDVSNLAKVARLAGVAKGVGASNNQAAASTVKHMGPVQYAKDTLALPAPTKPEFDLAPDLKQKEKVPSKQQYKKDDEPGVTEGAKGKVVFSGTGADGSKYEIIQSGDGFMIHANGKHIDTYGSLQRAMSVLKNEVLGLTKGVTEDDAINVPPGQQAITQPDGSTRISKSGSVSRADYAKNMAAYKAQTQTPEKIADFKQRMASGQGYTDTERQANLQQQQQYFGKNANTGDLDEQGMAEDDDAVAAFLARGGEVQRLKSAKPRKGERWQGSAHIGAAGGRGTKGRVSGLGANTGKSGKPVVTAEDSAPTPRSIVNPRSKSGVVSKADLEDYRLKSGNPTATLGQYMNQQQGKTFRKGGANDPDVIAATQNKAVAITAEPKPGSWQELAKLNNITDPTKLQAGTYINTPDGGNIYVNKGDTLSDIARYMRDKVGRDPQLQPGSDNKTSVQPTVSNPAPAPAAQTANTQSSQQNKGQNVVTKPPPLTDKDIASKKSSMSGQRLDLQPDSEKSEKAQPALTSSNSNTRIQAEIAALEREISRQKPSLDPKEQTRLGILNKELTVRQAAAAAAEAPAAVSAKVPVVPTSKYDPDRDAFLNQNQPYYNRRNSGMPSAIYQRAASMAQNESISQRLTKEFDHMLEHLLSEATNQHKIPVFTVPIIPDNMPFGKNFGGGGGSVGNAMRLSGAGRFSPASATKSQAMATQRNVGGKEITIGKKALNSKVNTTPASSNPDLPLNVQIAPSMRPAPTDKNFSDFLKGQGSQTFGPTMNTNKPTKVDIQDAGDFYPESKNITNRGITNTSEASLVNYGKKAAISQAGAKINKFFDRDNPEKVAAANRTIAKRTKGLARADARRRPYTAPSVTQDKQRHDLADKYPNIDELVRRAELNRDPQYDRADGQAYYDGRDAEQNYHKLKQIQRVIQGLSESLQRTQP